ncbi:hypothetical protein BRARA_G00097 [Brassica rapa]|uniref:Phorbol-ester/DAG-type domain-containing protein n=1 Tax=Brassica campestris TaxID=3711 RepID=A0A397YGP8_BRACM|nr:hypothetical protein BRARA_G00097 [Brassica rapa]
MEKLEVSSVHNHPLLPLTRFVFGMCKGCDFMGYIYGGYCCNELGCGGEVFHKECGEALPEINHSSHPGHLLKLFSRETYSCSLCGESRFLFGYSCSICNFKLDLDCARRAAPLPILSKPSVHEHPLELCPSSKFVDDAIDCKVCGYLGFYCIVKYKCVQCNLFFHIECVTFFPEAYHTSHPKHSLKYLLCEAAAPSYADKKCILCGNELGKPIHHCDVCNFSICTRCMRNPPPLGVVSLTTHDHQLHLVPRHIEFTCDACGTTGERSPYFCLQCNFMIHRECIGLPRVININRHNHRISYTPSLGQGKWKCGVCRKEVNGFYGAYTCAKCPTFAVHARCATRNDVWDMVEREGTPEEEEVAPYEVIDDTTIKHFSHDHNLRINKDGEILQESILCGACAFQICSEPFYSCEQCSSEPTDDEISCCHLCSQLFTGFMYTNGLKTIDVRCGSFSEPFVHASHPHPLYYSQRYSVSCSECRWNGELTCDECDFTLCFHCGYLPKKVMRHRYDDHPLSLYCGEESKWFYTCNDCGVLLHISCAVGSFTYMMPGPCLKYDKHGEVVSNTSVCRAVCTRCNIRCILPSIFKGYKDGVVEYFCSAKCLFS